MSVLAATCLERKLEEVEDEALGDWSATLPLSDYGRVVRQPGAMKHAPPMNPWFYTKYSMEGDYFQLPTTVVNRDKRVYRYQQSLDGSEMTAEHSPNS